MLCVLPRQATRLAAVEPLWAGYRSIAAIMAAQEPAMSATCLWRLINRYRFSSVFSYQPQRYNGALLYRYKLHGYSGI